MGNSCTSNSATHKVIVKTGIKKGAGTDGNVYVKLEDVNGRWSQEHFLNHVFRNDMEAGNTDTFHVDCPGLGKIRTICIRRDGSFSSDCWYLEKVVISVTSTNENSKFPVNRFIHADTELKLSEFDSSLPADDKHPEQRTKELEKKREIYKLVKKEPGIPSQNETLPQDEDFNFKYVVFLGKTLVQLGIETKFADIITGEFKKLSDFEEVYIGAKLTRPAGIDRWRSDEEFGSQRLIGVSPAQIHLCQAIPEGFGVTSDMVVPFLEGRSLEQAMNEKKIYIVDYTFLDGLECTDKTNSIPAPYGLFYSRNSGEFVPIAIQLMPNAAEDNPVFLPSDPEYTWLMAKMWFNLADASVHQSLFHLGLTHHFMESVSVCTNRQLSPSHPIYRLLAPHFLYIIAINDAALSQLTAPGTWVDQTMEIGQVGMHNIIRRRWANWNIIEDGHFINNLKKRGVDDVKALPNYFYRDDGVLLWNAIKSYVSEIVESVYSTPDKLANDTELNAFASELSSSNGAGIQGVPENFTTVAELVDILTVFIFTSSVQHAAVNFGQYDEYGFSPNYPANIRTPRPTNKDPLTEDDIVRALPTKDEMLSVVLVTRLLSSKATDSLGYFDIPFACDPVSLRALAKFTSELKNIGSSIAARNTKLVRQYPYLHPEAIPNAISI